MFKKTENLQYEMYICSGISGSGKSFLTKQLKDKLNDSGRYSGRYYDILIFSTDYYWIRPDNVYDFNFRLLKEAHLWNQKTVRDWYNYEDFYFPPIAIIDNTNLTTKEITPYLDIAKAYSAKVTIVEPQTEWRYDVNECFKRNQHGVPLETLQKMLSRKQSVEELQKFADTYLGVK